MNDLFPVATFERTPLSTVNDLLVEWRHKMGPFCRPDFGGTGCYVLYQGESPVALAIHSRIIPAKMGVGIDYMTRENTLELARLCACRPGLCRVALRLWRDFVFAEMPQYKFAVSYQDADLHTGNTYRFDGWQEVGSSRSGTDRRTGRAGRNKRIWQYPPMEKLTK